MGENIQIVRWVFFAVLLGLCETSFAANLLQNADFANAAPFANWTNYDVITPWLTPCPAAGPCGTFQNSPGDECCGEPASGSAAAQFTSLASDMIQCVPGIVAGTSYDFGAWMRTIPPTKQVPSRVTVIVWWISTPDCLGDVVGSSQSAAVTTTDWTRIAVPSQVAPATTQSAAFIIRNTSYSQPTEVDSVFLGPSGTVPVELQSFSVD